MPDSKKQGKTIILVSDDFNFAFSLADVVARMHKGRLVRFEPVDVFVADWPRDFEYPEGRLKKILEYRGFSLPEEDRWRYEAGRYQEERNTGSQGTNPKTVAVDGK